MPPRSPQLKRAATNDNLMDHSWYVILYVLVQCDPPVAQPPVALTYMCV